MAIYKNRLMLRVRYSETDQMGTFYNSRALEWFECGRSEWSREMGFTYRQMEQRGIMLPLVESRVFYKGRAKYDDQMEITTTARMSGKASVRFDVSIKHSDTGLPIAEGYTVHAIVNPSGKPTRPPEWFVKLFQEV